jgi:ketosteroid isomerase-like protein
VLVPPELLGGVVPDGILRSGYEALGRGDAGPLLELLGDDFEWREPELPGYPLSGVHTGPEGFATGVLAPLAELLEGLIFDVGEVIEAAERVVVTGVMRGHPAGGSEAEWELPFAHVWELGADGLPTTAHAYFDRSRLTVAATRRQLADAAEELMDQAAEIRRQWSRLGDALRAAGLDEGEIAAIESEEGEDESLPVGSASARFTAIDMAQEGSTREEVEAYLREELGVEDTDELLDEAFATAARPGGPPHDRPGAVDASRLTRLFARNRG